MSSHPVDEREFIEMINRRARTLLSLLEHVSTCQTPTKALTRPLLGDLLSHAVQIEELLDSYDAAKNCKWCQMRSLVAAVKSFADVNYELLHIQHRIPRYRLLPSERDFAKATDRALEFAGTILVDVAGAMISTAQSVGLKIVHRDDIAEMYDEYLPKGHLPKNCGTRRVETVAETVKLLATGFLNLTSNSRDVRAASRAKPEDYHLCLTASLREERLRSLEFQFHNLQSQYDTYVSGTEAEGQDDDLPRLRGHASVVFHLLRIATLFAHYYERHVNRKLCKAQSSAPTLVTPEALLSELMNYSITFIDQYIGCAVNLCQKMLQRYAEIGEVEVAVPQYRGFHVRPSTLVAKIVLHFGSKVEMVLADQKYDASSSLDLFRANEKINAQKRRWLACEIARLGLVSESQATDDVIELVREIVLSLAAKGKLILYEQPLEMPDRLCPTEGTLLEKVVNETGRLLAMGKIDIGTDMKGRFIGDKRVLADIKLLAENGYGEDSFGNNIALPEGLGYLRR